MAISDHAETEDEFLRFDEDGLGDKPPSRPRTAWRILIVDDDRDVHQATIYALHGISILERPLEFLHAYSAAQAIEILRCERNVAVILLDVVMEADDAGLKAVDVIRNTLGLANPRIVLRTGQPGYAPEIETIRRYDINDYKTKSELTRSRMYTTLTTAVRSYDQLCRLEASRYGLERIVAASNQFISQTGVHEFSSGVITQIAAFMGVEPEGMVCVRAPTPEVSGVCHVMSATGRFSRFMGRKLEEVDDPQVVDSLLRCLRERRNLVELGHVTLFFRGRNHHDFIAYIATHQQPRDIDQRLLEVFCTNIAICGDNVHLVEELQNLAYHDTLLGLPNRSYLVEAIDRRLASDKQTRLALALLDVDQFAEINDMLGHRYGDQLLEAIARRIEMRFGAQCVIARVSDDVFGIFGDADHVNLETLQPFFNATYEIESVKRPVSMAAGFVAVTGGSDTCGTTLLKDGSIAVKHAKAHGQGQFAVFSPEIAAITRERTRLLHDLRNAFMSGALYLAYQPLLDLQSGRVTGVEALLRWPTPDGGHIAPDRFIPVAEHSGLIIALGAWVLRSAMDAAKRIHAAGHPDIRMAVNVSTNQFRQPGFIAEVNAILADCGLPPEALELEVTESVAALGLTFAEGSMLRLRNAGISVAIDDFGTGYSSLSYLGSLPANRLKIDHSFIWAMSSGESGVNIPKMVIPLGRQLGMKVVAEGVETVAQANLLKEMGCDEVQGYLYAKPMPLDQLLYWLQARP
ncbi:MAG: EAL domain-containing protein [Betaproteobacteria bacterium]